MSEIDLLIEELEDIENNPIKPFVAIRIGGYLRNYKYHEYRIDELEAERRWRIIADGEMPDDRATVLVAFTEYPEQIDILTATYYKHYEGFGGVDNWWHIEGWHSGNVTHWMPRPQPPEVK